MRRALLPAVVLALALAGTGVARAETATISMPGKYFDPPRTTVVAGDLVVFSNNDLVSHDVRIGGGLFDSGVMARFSDWSQQFDQPGGYPFVCTLHAFMSGHLDVVGATLTAAPDGVLAGEALSLSGRAPVGTARVGVERSVGGGEWIATGDFATPAPDGTFSAQSPAAEGASYRVTTPAGPSLAVTPRVTARVDVHVAVRRARRRTTVDVHAMPAPRGFVARSSSTRAGATAGATTAPWRSTRTARPRSACRHRAAPTRASRCGGSAADRRWSGAAS